MNLRNLSVIAAVGAATLFPVAANAGITVFQYLFKSGSFSYNGTVFSGMEQVTLANFNNSIQYGTGSLSLSGMITNLTATLVGPGSNGFTLKLLSGVYGPSVGNTISGNYAGGIYSPLSVLPIGNVSGKSGSFSMSSVNYVPGGGSSIGTGSFNGFISVNNTPELGTSASMITMLMGAGFMSLRRRKKA